MKEAIAIRSLQAPQPIGPYSQAIQAPPLIFCSGQIAINPDNGNLREGGIVEQTKQTIENLQAILQAAGSSLEEVIKTDIYLKNMSDFSSFNEVYATYFANQPQPTRTTVVAADLPKKALVEIACVAYHP